LIRTEPIWESPAIPSVRKMLKDPSEGGRHPNRPIRFKQFLDQISDLW
jgi:hypothetical protein